jgi:ribosomal protein L20
MRAQAATEEMIGMREPKSDWRKLWALREEIAAQAGQLAAKDAKIAELEQAVIALADALRTLLIAIEIADPSSERIPAALVAAGRQALKDQTSE